MQSIHRASVAALHHTREWLLIAAADASLSGISFKLFVIVTTKSAFDGEISHDDLNILFPRNVDIYCYCISGTIIWKQEETSRDLRTRLIAQNWLWSWSSLWFYTVCQVDGHWFVKHFKRCRILMRSPVHRRFVNTQHWKALKIRFGFK
jgi:hypothetical protein